MRESACESTSEASEGTRLGTRCLVDTRGASGSDSGISSCASWLAVGPSSDRIDVLWQCTIPEAAPVVLEMCAASLLRSASSVS